jgi:hypothetical protein
MSVRSALSRRAVRGIAIAGIAAAALGTAGTAFAGTAAGQHVKSIVPTEECSTWSGIVYYFPVLTTKSHNVTAVLEGVLSNCSDFGTPQGGTGLVFGVLSGTATKTKATLSGRLAVTWPASSGLNPTIVPVTLRKVSVSASYSFGGVISAGAGKGAVLSSAYNGSKPGTVNGGTLQNITGTKPFAIYVNEG